MNRIALLIFMVASCAYGIDEYQEKLPWELGWELEDWGKVRRADRVGLAMLTSFDPSSANEDGAPAVLQFNDMIKGAGGVLEVIIPNSMRDPAEMPTSWENLRQRDPSKPWQWEAGKAYGFHCTLDAERGVWRVSWAVPVDDWNAFKTTVQRQQAEFTAYIRERKLEISAIDRIWREKYRSGEATKEEADEIRRANIEKVREIRTKMTEESQKYGITSIDIHNIDEMF